MLIEEKMFSSIEEKDIHYLVLNGIMESKKLEFKRELPGNSDRNKKDFLADICAFANASGGLIIYGVDEDKGKAIAIRDVSINDLDKEILRLESLIQDGIAPRIPGIQTRVLELSEGGNIVVIKIPISWASPHMVNYEGSSKFYSRNSAGKYLLDIQEIRAAFIESDSLSNKIKEFRLSRLGKIVAGETPIPMGEGAKIILHLIPITTFQRQSIVDLGDLVEKFRKLSTISGPFPDGYRINLDGLITFNEYNNSCVDYTQIFRNGAIETISEFILKQESDTKPKIPGIYFEQKIIETCIKLLDFQYDLGIEPPIFISLSLVGVKGYIMGVSQVFTIVSRDYMLSHEIERDTLLIPEVMLQNFGSFKADALLKPIFDAVWNAAGWKGSINYDKEGNWSENVHK